MFIIIVLPLLVISAVLRQSISIEEVGIDSIGQLDLQISKEQVAQNTVSTISLSNPLYSAEILGLLVESISIDQLAYVHAQLLQYKVIVIRNQSSLSVEGLRGFTSYFGNLYSHLETQSHMNGYADVNIVSNIRDPVTDLHIGLYGAHVENFHSDLSWSQLPCKLTILKSEIRPDGCGDTQFIDSISAYSYLSQDRKDKLKGLKGQYCYLKTRNLAQETGLSPSQIETASKCAIHPIITSHPETGAKNIFANPSHTKSVEGYEKDESDRILSFLYDHAKKSKFIYDHVWLDGDLLLWDNRAVQHRATGCPDSKPRKLIRTTVLNDAAPVE